MQGTKMKKIFIGFCFILSVASIFIFNRISSADPQLKDFIDNVEQAKEGMTLWQMIASGGFIMIILALLSVAAIALIIFNFLNLNVQKLAPRAFVEGVIPELEKGKINLVSNKCQTDKNMISRIILAGVDRKSKGNLLVRESMEIAARKEVGSLWQGISYLADVATITPLIGLLGTVLGMIQAFNVIAFQTAVVKPILLAGGVSKAMVTTAGGLIVAIPAMLFYSYFKGKVQDISNAVESYTTDIIKVIEEAKN